MSTIHGNSSDPVLIKKIYLRTWLLRDEIEDVIRKRLEAGQKLSDINIEKLRQEYHFKGALQIEKPAEEKPKEGLKIVENDEIEEVESATEEENEQDQVVQAESASEEDAAPTIEASAEATEVAQATIEPTLSIAATPETNTETDPAVTTPTLTVVEPQTANNAPIDPAAVPAITTEGVIPVGTSTPSAEISAVSTPAAPPEPSIVFQEANVLEPVSKDNNILVINQRHPQLADGKISKGTTLLSEISIDNILFFSSKPFLDGQSIVIEFLVPKRFVLNADIIYCRPFNHKSRIISEEKLSYRVSAKFTFLKPGERTIIRHFLQAIEPEIAVPTKAPKKQASSDDDLDALEDLDL